MGFAAAEAAIRGRFDTQFPGLQASVLIQHENRAAVRPGPTQEWVRLAVLGGAARLPEIGSRLSDSLGRIVVQIFVPTAQLDSGTHAAVGTARARAIADSVATIFQGQTFSGVSCFATEEIPVGADPRLPYWQMNASTRFHFENTPA